MKKLAIICAIVAACGGDDAKTTQGDVATAIAEAYCAEMAECGTLPADRVEACVIHTVNHLCEVEKTCENEVTEEVEESLPECLGAVEAIQEEDSCILVFFGVAPEECWSVLDALGV